MCTMYIYCTIISTEAALLYVPTLPFLVVAKTPSAHWHHFSDSSLAPGLLLPWVMKCKAMYIPYLYTRWPKCMTSCCHHLLKPSLSHTTSAGHPPPLVANLHQLLCNMSWCLADATPQCVMLDSRFVHGLWNLLGWESNQSLSLSDLHPSLENLDHLQCLINTVHCMEFLHKTGFEDMH